MTNPADERRHHLEDFAERLCRLYDPRFGTYAGGPDHPDEQVWRLSVAMDQVGREEWAIEHETAVMLCRVIGQGRDVPHELIQEWNDLFNEKRP